MKEEIKMARIEVRITINEQTKIKNKANELGISVSAYMRKTALNHRIIIKTDNEMIRQIRFIGNNINQIAHRLNINSDTLNYLDTYTQMEEYKQMLQLIIDKIRKI
ncbi:mobilization protein [Paludibacter propionicigenes WB4]|uniref:Mobilization protein n=1 Tax=Paludibacter propionicigenes (strain DSM 17365 / JCM 13257 / WB4) TaxID=694427 RepID=E4T4T1_PALPW|nr:plasmid mobilization relaxosome protein MobC [Paludibacter propionicigenes]ADQ79725.1 mobilization protein [Paludibacter propionicigenes WB4]